MTRAPLSATGRYVTVESMTGTPTAAAGATTVSARRRVPAIDIARALAIIGVVFGHSVDGLINSGTLAPSDATARVHDALYVLRMPAMAFVMGFFIPGSVAKRGTPRYLANRVLLMLYLYVLWFFVQGVVEVATSSLKNKPRPPATLLEVWVTYGHLWFLTFLAVATLVVVTIRPWPGRARLLLLVGYLAVGVALWGWNVQVVGLRGLSLLFFVAAGAAVGLRRMGSLMLARPGLWLAAGVVATVAYVLMYSLDPAPATDVEDVVPGVGTRALSLTMAVVGIVALLALAVALARIPRVSEFLAHLGRVTLPIYLAHLIVVAGSREALEVAGVDPVLVYVVVGTVLGMLVPYVLFLHADRLRLGWLFDLPGTGWRWVDRRFPDRAATAPAPPAPVA